MRIAGVFADESVKVSHTGAKSSRLTGGDPVYRVSEGVRSAHGQDGAVVLDVERGQMFSLNHVGSRILELLENGATESEITDVIRREFHAHQGVVENDVREFLAALRKHNLLMDQQNAEVPGAGN